MRAANQAVYFFAGSKLIELHLDSLEERIVSEVDTPLPSRRPSESDSGWKVYLLDRDRAGNEHRQEDHLLLLFVICAQFRANATFVDFQGKYR